MLITPADKISIALIDDDSSFSDKVKNFIARRYPMAILNVFNSGEDAIKGIFAPPDIIILDYHLETIGHQGLNGIEVLIKLKQSFNETPVVFLSDLDKVEIAADTIKHGAHDYIVKNETCLHKLELIINHLSKFTSLKRSNSMQKTMNILIWVLFAIIIGCMIYLRMK